MNTIPHMTLLMLDPGPLSGLTFAVFFLLSATCQVF